MTNASEVVDLFSNPMMSGGGVGMGGSGADEWFSPSICMSSNKLMYY